MIRLLLILLITLGLKTGAQGQSIQWTAFEHLGDSLRTERKPLLVFIQTSWCKFCKMQEHTTFADKDLTQELNRKFYLLRLDAESKADILFLGRTYPFNPNGYHELAETLAKGNGEITFPTTLLFSENLQLLKRYSGYVGPEELKSVLRNYLRKPGERDNTQHE